MALPSPVFTVERPWQEFRWNAGDENSRVPIELLIWVKCPLAGNETIRRSPGSDTPGFFDI